MSSYNISRMYRDLSPEELEELEEFERFNRKENLFFLKEIEFPEIPEEIWERNRQAEERIRKQKEERKLLSKSPVKPKESFTTMILNLPQGEVGDSFEEPKSLEYDTKLYLRNLKSAFSYFLKLKFKKELPRVLLKKTKNDLILTSQGFDYYIHNTAFSKFFQSISYSIVQLSSLTLEPPFEVLMLATCFFDFSWCAPEIWQRSYEDIRILLLTTLPDLIKSFGFPNLKHQSDSEDTEYLSFEFFNSHVDFEEVILKGQREVHTHVQHVKVVRVSKASKRYTKLKYAPLASEEQAISRIPARVPFMIKSNRSCSDVITFPGLAKVEELEDYSELFFSIDKKGNSTEYETLDKFKTGFPKDYFYTNEIVD